MDAPLYVTSFVWVMNKAKYDGMSAEQKKVMDDHCTNQWAVRAASPWVISACRHPEVKSDPAHEVYSLTPAQLAEWREASKAWLRHGRGCEEGWRRSGRHSEGPEGTAAKRNSGIDPNGDYGMRDGGEPFAAVVIRGRQVADQLHGPLHRLDRVIAAIFVGGCARCVRVDHAALLFPYQIPDSYMLAAAPRHLIFWGIAATS